MNNNLFFSNKTDEWSTPPEFFQELDREFCFTLDPCATEENHKCQDFYTIRENGLAQSWAGRTVFCNPPYSQAAQWIEKAYHEGHQENTTVVLLIPARTDTRYFHNFVLNRAEVRFIKGRLKFGGCKNAAPFPSMLVIYRGPCKNETK